MANTLLKNYSHDPLFPLHISSSSVNLSVQPSRYIPNLITFLGTSFFPPPPSHLYHLPVQPTFNPLLSNSFSTKQLEVSFKNNNQFMPFFMTHFNLGFPCLPEETAKPIIYYMVFFFATAPTDIQPAGLLASTSLLGFIPLAVPYLFFPQILKWLISFSHSRQNFFTFPQFKQ